MKMAVLRIPTPARVSQASRRCAVAPAKSRSRVAFPLFYSCGGGRGRVRVKCSGEVERESRGGAVNVGPGTPVRSTNILVVGATGTLGRQIVRRALDEGYDVRCLVRPRPAPADFLRDWGATVVNADLSKPDTIPATLVGIHTVIDCATGRPEEPIKTVDWEGKVALIQCAKAMGIQKYVFYSIHNCDKHPEVPLMEIKSCTEKFLRDSGLNHIVIRLCGFMQGLIGQYAVPILEEKSVWGTDAPTRIAYMDTQVYTVDFVILCIGRFSDVPNIPEFPPNKGPEVFGGKVTHSMDYASLDCQSAAELVKGKQVTAVGLQKSALDIVMECSAVNGVEHPCRILYRTEHWNLPDYLPWGIPLTYLYLNRFSELMVHKPDEGFLLSLVATVLAPLRWAFSKLVESHIRRKAGLTKFGMVPNHSFHQEVNSCLFSTLPEKFYDKVEEGSIILKKARRFWFCKEGILVEGEASPLKTDLVILATGFRGDKKLKDIFVSSTFQNLMAGSPNATVPLYRECIHPQIPQLAVIGFSESASNLYTSEMRCRWVAELLDGTFQLPNIEAMKKDVEKWEEYLKKYSGQYYRRSCVAGLQIWYNDLLCKDMRWNPRRKKGLLAELFEPYGPLDYSS